VTGLGYGKSLTRFTDGTLTDRVSEAPKTRLRRTAGTCAAKVGTAPCAIYKRMKLGSSLAVAARRRRAFSLIDALWGMAAAGVMFGALYAGIAFGFNTIKFARENTRATQIMLEKMEIIRLYTWDQLTDTTPPTFVPTNAFIVPYYAVGGTNSQLVYTGRVVIADAPLTTSYAANMKQVTVSLNWSTGKTPRSRSMTTYVTKNGMQSYVW